MNWEIGHVFNDFFIMPKSLEIAAKSERRFLPKEKIIGFYTPPRSEEITNQLKDLLTLKNVPNLTPPFQATKGRWHSFYGEKIRLADMNSPNVLHLDCDCLTVHDPSRVFDADFDIAFIDATPWKKENVLYTEAFQRNWNNLFESHGKKPIPFFQASVIFAKDNILKEIKDEYISIMEEDIPLLESFYPKNEYAFALCCSEKKVKYLGFDIVGEFEWRDKPFYNDIKEWEKEETPLIWHIGNKGLHIGGF